MFLHQASSSATERSMYTCANCNLQVTCTDLCYVGLQVVMHIFCSNAWCHGVRFGVVVPALSVQGRGSQWFSVEHEEERLTLCCRLHTGVDGIGCGKSIPAKSTRMHKQPTKQRVKACHCYPAFVTKVRIRCSHPVHMFKHQYHHHKYQNLTKT